ncbi:MAG TPA: NAD-dependent epimerase/dehydratase family protein, partial [Actinophytocola sp.]|nr:NAD-dependent epimerase/dehydratase family protein [Actinophytocola sp.]
MRSSCRLHDIHETGPGRTEPGNSPGSAAQRHGRQSSGVHRWDEGASRERVVRGRSARRRRGHGRNRTGDRPELQATGHRVRAVNRSGRRAAGPGVEVVAADATDAARMRQVCDGAAVVYNCVNPPFLRWRELFPAAVDGVLAGASAAGAVLVFADDTWMYGRVAEPMTEDTPYRPVSAKGVLRAWLAERVLAAHHRGDVRAVIGRAGELYGPGVESLFGRNLFGAALAGRTARWLGRLDLALTPLFIDDFARGLLVLAERSAAHGGVWHVPHPDPTTGRAFVDTIFGAAG